MMAKEPMGRAVLKMQQWGLWCELSEGWEGPGLGRDAKTQSSESGPAEENVEGKGFPSTNIAHIKS